MKRTSIPLVMAAAFVLTAFAGPAAAATNCI